MTDTIELDNFTFLDAAVQDCPYPAYERLLAEAPVFHDAKAGFWVVTRYEDIRAILTDIRRFSSAATTELVRDTLDPVRAEAARALFEAEGWLPTATLSLTDGPRHKEVRAIFQQALRAGKVRELDPLIARLASDLVDGFVAKGTADIVTELCVPLPLMAICSQVGVTNDEVWAIKRWTDAWVRRFSMMISWEEEQHCIREEIAYQRHFIGIIHALRAKPDGSILSDLVNTALSDGSCLSDAEILSHLFTDVFVGGSETTTNAMSEGILLLCQNPDQYAALMADLDGGLTDFLEEALRLQSPVQGLFRVTTEDVTMHGVTIPARSLVNVRFPAANRDERHFACPNSLDIGRGNSASHLAFGSGLHHCIGAPLARRELYWGYRELLSRCRNIRLVPGANDLSHVPGMMLRALKSLKIEWDV